MEKIDEIMKYVDKSKMTPNADGELICSVKLSDLKKVQCDQYKLSQQLKQSLQQTKPAPVEVPKFVAEWINYIQSLNWDILYLYTPEVIDKPVSKGVKQWLDNEANRELIARAWLDGYTVEKEPLYKVVLFENDNDRQILVTSGEGYRFEWESENEGYYKENHIEAEIKAIDERYWAFAVPVEEED